MSAAAKREPFSGAGLMLGMMLALACCIAAGGIIAARREIEARRDRDRQALHALGSALQAEVRKLEELYEGHLKSMGVELVQSMRNSDGARQLAQNIEGIRRVSWLYWKSASSEMHLSIGFPADPPLPEPTIEKEHSGLPRPRVMLDARTLFADAGGNSSGWIDEPGKPLMFYIQILGTAVVLTIDRAEVEKAMSGHFESWLAEGFRTVEKLGGPDGVLDSHGRTLRSAGSLPDRRPDVVAPVVSRFGVWQVVSWDHQVTQVVHHLPTLLGSLALAVLVAGCGLGLGLEQGRAAARARQRVSFVNRVSHELRTPMTNILLNLDLIEEAVPEGVSGRFALVREEAGRLGRLIENVLTFSRKEEGRLKLQNVACQPMRVVSAVVRQFEPAMKRWGINLEVSHDGPDADALLDADALAQIAANLLSNVEKYSPNAPAALRTHQTADTFILTVADAGEGIALRDVGRIFEPFVRVDDRVEAGVSGTGLGLSISRDLARRMGGDLRLLPADKGACFELRIPLVPAPPLDF